MIVCIKIAIDRHVERKGIAPPATKRFKRQRRSPQRHVSSPSADNASSNRSRKTDGRRLHARLIEVEAYAELMINTGAIWLGAPWGKRHRARKAFRSTSAHFLARSGDGRQPAQLRARKRRSHFVASEHGAKRRHIQTFFGVEGSTFIRKIARRRTHRCPKLRKALARSA